MPASSMATIKFGTDGWRGIIADDFTFENVRICAQAIADYVRSSGLSQRGLVIGYDTRFASEDFAAAAAEVITGNDIKVHLCSKPSPTPVVSYTVPLTNAAGAIVITASHNPASWNGLKYRSPDGASAAGEIISQIEQNVARTAQDGNVRRLSLDMALRNGLLSHLDPSTPYFSHLNRLVDLEALRRQGLTVLVDPMYGAGAGYFRELLEGGSTKVTEINAERNPSFPGIQPEPIARNLSKLSRLVVRKRADVGLSTDGDADRIGVIDENGSFLNQHQVFALLCFYLLEVRGERGALVKTLTSTEMISKLGKIYGVPVYETPVGFKYVAPLMIREHALLGGEESGGYGFHNHIPERDGILAGLYFLDLMTRTRKTPSQLLSDLYSRVGPHYYERVDSHVSEYKRRAILDRLSRSLPDILAGTKIVRLDTTDGHRFILADGSWLLIRFSGTEPLVRLYAEAESTARVAELLNEGRRLVEI
jgi:alpha-D-glucose phosphate-specific phosphoglucomutase